MKFQRDYRSCWFLFLTLLFVSLLVGVPEFVDAATQREGIDRGMHEKLIEPAIPNEELRSAEKFWEEADRFILIGDIQAYGTFSDLGGESDLWGGSFYGLVAPAYKLGERMIFILIFSAIDAIVETLGG